MRRASSAGAPRGVVLLEVLVALTILGIAGATAASMAVGASDAVRRAQRADAEVEGASDFMEAVALWTRDDLDRRLGSRRQGPWRLVVGHPVTALYVVELTDSAGTYSLIRTALFRPEPFADRVSIDAR